MKFSIRSLLLAVLLLACLLAIARPAYRYVTVPDLSIQRSHHVSSNTKFPVVSMNEVAAHPSDQVRILLLHRQTKEPDDINYCPDWFEPHRTSDGIILRGHSVNQAVNAWETYPHSDADLTVVYASDDDDPRVATAPYSTYALIPKDDTISMWQQLVEDLK